jgi:phosphatidylserine decarboxylase
LLAAPGALSYVLTNYVPRSLATRFMRWFSRIEQPLVRRASLWAWQGIADLRLHEAKKSSFTSIHDCFIRELVPGARPINQSPGVIVSPCDGIVGAHGDVADGCAYQAKGSPYQIGELLADADLATRFRGGCYVTLRLTPSMYHRFHAPDDCEVLEVIHVPGGMWNVTPATLSRRPRVFCRNERAVVSLRLAHTREAVTLVPVAAILVASLRLHFLDSELSSRYTGPQRVACRTSLRRGEEMGYFQHGSTIIVFGTPGLRLCEHVLEGVRVRMGEPLLRHAGAVPSAGA